MDIIIKAFLEGKEVEIIERDGLKLINISELEKVLKFRNVEKAVKHFNENEKIVEGIPAKKIIHLTEIGLYRFLMNSSKATAIPFQIWVSKIIQDIMVTGKYELSLENLYVPEKKISIKHKQVEQLNQTTNEVIKIYPTFEAVIKEFKMPRKSLRLACDSSDVICKGFKWRLKEE
jgi:prophage antirepressor-like protein